MSHACGADTLAQGIGFPEAPTWTADGQLIVASVSRASLFRVHLGGGPPQGIFECAGYPTGLAEDPAGSLLIALSAHSDIRRDLPRHVRAGMQRWLRGSGGEDAWVTGVERPNDCAFGPDGRLWYSEAEGDPYDARLASGRVCAVDLATGIVTKFGQPFLFPNGLAFGPHDGALYVAETAGKQVARLLVKDRAKLEPAGAVPVPAGHPDGIAFDAEGKLHVAGTSSDEVFVFDRSGVLAERISLGPSFPTSVAFAGPELNLLVVTAARGGRVLAVARSVPGAPLHGQRPHR